MRDTLGEIAATIPKPRGEGTYSWFRYHTIRAACLLNGQGRKCPIKGCPQGVLKVGPVEFSHCWLHEPDRSPEWRASMSRISPGSAYRRSGWDPSYGKRSWPRYFRELCGEHFRAWWSSLWRAK
jgi:hypothetical protein